MINRVQRFVTRYPTAMSVCTLPFVAAFLYSMFVYSCEGASLFLSIIRCKTHYTGHLGRFGYY